MPYKRCYHIGRPYHIGHTVQWASIPYWAYSAMHDVLPRKEQILYSENLRKGSFLDVFQYFFTTGDSERLKSHQSFHLFSKLHRHHNPISLLITATPAAIKTRTTATVSSTTTTTTTSATSSRRGNNDSDNKQTTNNHSNCE
jgi:hypothetical protein